MKKYILIIVVFSIPFHTIAQNWLWANSVGGPGQDISVCLDIENNGMVYLGGQIMEPEAYFGNDTLAVSGWNDIFLSKFDAFGNILWAKRFGSNNAMLTGEGAVGIVFDEFSAAGYMVGAFYTSCTFGSFSLNAAFSGDRQIFIAKFDANGTFLWAKSAGGVGSDACTGIALDPSGSIYLSGTLEYGGMFDGISITGGGYLAKYSNDGNCLWAKKLFTNCSATNIKLFNSDIFTVGTINGSNMIIDTMQINMPNYSGQILSRFDSSGHVKWTQIFGGPHKYQGRFLSLDNSGNVYVAGTYSGSYATFGNDSIFSLGYKDSYLARYDQNGNLKWVRNINSSYNSSANGVTTDFAGNIYFTGSFSGIATFGTYQINSAFPDIEEIFVAKYDSTGNCLGVIHFGEGVGNVITTDPLGNVYFCADFNNTMTLNNGITLQSYGGSDIFLAKMEAITGISQPNKSPDNNLSIYANPTTGKCNITIPEEFINETKLLLTIYNLQGAMIQQQELYMEGDKIKLDLEQEAKGIYTATLSNGKKVYTGKIVFE